MTQWSGISAIQGPHVEPAKNSSVGSGSSKEATTGHLLPTKSLIDSLPFLDLFTCVENLKYL